jgi:signal transduction histidine kinase
LRSAALGKINQDQEDALEKVLRQTENLEGVVNVILESASVETGAVDVRKEELVLSEFLEELKQHCDGRVVSPGVALVWDYPTPLPVIRSDPGKLKINLMSLIPNAFKFTDTGEIRISARHNAEHHRMLFTISDTGINIAATQLRFRL